ncbi:WW domain-binding protein 11 [Folsomia candida]|uniref:DUF243 domain-containing protein n=1 Tax=Folsomia candida TaxID=158441 RepID=A0A226CV39_FOLCA|nr:WW domain-binding protein 11 [Folsomia candida]OXA37265.1 hypothetical protein Fcan01_27987 [Folsomia candida]
MSNKLVIGVLFMTFGLISVSEGAIASMGEPDWSIAKAEVVQELYSYEPHLPRSLFPSLFRPPPLPAASQQRVQIVPTPTPPKYAKFSIQDKKDQPPQGQQGQPGQVKYLPQNGRNQNDNKPPPLIGSGYGPPPVLGPVYEKHPTTPPPPPQSPPPPPQSPPPHIITEQQPIYSPPQNSGGYPDATAVDRQTIVWPDTMEQSLQMSGEETALRFVVHKAGDEGEIRKALVDDGNDRGQDVKFIEGPTLRIQRHQKVYLPPKKKTVVYILLKEPQILTDVEVVGQTEEPVPEVFITYQRSDGGVRTKHYSPDAVKGDKYLRELGSSLGDHNHVTRSISPPALQQAPPPSQLPVILAVGATPSPAPPLRCPSNSNGDATQQKS